MSSGGNANKHIANKILRVTLFLNERAKHPNI